MIPARGPQTKWLKRKTPNRVGKEHLESSGSGIIWDHLVWNHLGSSGSEVIWDHLVWDRRVSSCMQPTWHSSIVGTHKFIVLHTMFAHARRYACMSWCVATALARTYCSTWPLAILGQVLWRLVYPNEDHFGNSCFISHPPTLLKRICNQYWVLSHVVHI